MDAVLVEAVRSPMCLIGEGGLAGVPPMDIVRQVIEALICSSGVDAADVDRVFVQCGDEVGDHLEEVGGLTWPLSGLPARIPAITIDRWCGTGQEILHHASRSVASGGCDIVIAVGVEATHSRPREVTTNNSAARCRAPQSRELAAELLTVHSGIDRAHLDAYTVRSNRRAAEVAAAGEFEKEIVPIHVTDRCSGSRRLVLRDEIIAPDITIEQLGALAPVLQNSQLGEQHPGIEWSITCGNSARRAVGAAAVLLMSEKKAARLGINPRARIHRLGVARGASDVPLAAPLRATESILTAAKMSPNQLDHVEVDEEFACIPLAWRSQFAVESDLFNPRGGALALGNPRACCGLRQLVTMVGALETTGGRYGLQTMNANGGMAYSSIVERL